MQEAFLENVAPKPCSKKKSTLIFYEIKILTFFLTQITILLFLPYRNAVICSVMPSLQQFEVFILHQNILGTE